MPRSRSTARTSRPAQWPERRSRRTPSPVPRSTKASSVLCRKHSAETATRADTAANADKVGGKTAAELASPAAYAYVDAGPSTISVPAEWSFGLESATVTRENSFTCIRGLGVQPRHAQVTPYRVPAGTTNDIPNVALSDNNFCDGREEVAVQMVDGGTGAPNDTQRYYIALYK